MRSWLTVLLAAVPVWARHDAAGCGTTRENSNEELFLHRQALRARAVRPLGPAAAAVSGNRDIGNIAIVEDAGGVVERLNQFNLDSNTLTFTPITPASAPTAAGAARYRYAVAAQGYDT